MSISWQKTDAGDLISATMLRKAIVILLILSSQVLLGEGQTTAESSTGVPTEEITTVLTTESATTSTTPPPGSTASTSSPASTAAASTAPPASGAPASAAPSSAASASTAPPASGAPISTASTASTASTSTTSPASTTSTTNNPNVTTTTTTRRPTTAIPFPSNLGNCTAYQDWFSSNITGGQNYTMRNGYYEVDDPNSNGRITVFCDFLTDGGYWTAIQVRSEDEVGQAFQNSNFSDYENGFFTNTTTNAPSSYWIGFERIIALIGKGETSLRIDMTTCGGVVFSAVYDNFQIGPKAGNYSLISADFVESMSNAKDSLYNDNSNYNLISRTFYTKNSYDKPTNGKYNCASLFGGGWWYNQCGLSNLNGIHYPGCYYSALFADGIRWGSMWSGYYSPNRVEIKLRNPSKAPPTTPAVSTPPAASAANEGTTAAVTTAASGGL